MGKIQQNLYYMKENQKVLFVNNLTKSSTASLTAVIERTNTMGMSVVVGFKDEIWGMYWKKENYHEHLVSWFGK